MGYRPIGQEWVLRSHYGHRHGNSRRCFRRRGRARTGRGACRWRSWPFSYLNAKRFRCYEGQPAGSTRRSRSQCGGRDSPDRANQSSSSHAPFGRRDNLDESRWRSAFGSEPCKSFIIRCRLKSPNRSPQPRISVPKTHANIHISSSPPVPPQYAANQRQADRAINQALRVRRPR